MRNNRIKAVLSEYVLQDCFFTREGENKPALRLRGFLRVRIFPRQGRGIYSSKEFLGAIRRKN